MLARFKKNTKEKSEQNVVEAVSMSATVFINAWGSCVLYRRCLLGRVTRHFSTIGFLVWILRLVTFFYLTYIVFKEDQSIVRSFVTTKLHHYGDHYESITAIVFITYLFWKLPFDLNGATEYYQILVDIDEELKTLGEEADYVTQGRCSLFLMILQVVVSFLHATSTYGTLCFIDEHVPLPKVFTLTFIDTCSLLLTATYCNYVSMVTRRYRRVNQILSEIIELESLHDKVYVLNQNFVEENGARCLLKSRDNQLRATVRKCADIHSKLYKATQMANQKFGPALVFIFILPLTYIILNLFYFVEATSQGLLFRDLKRYLSFVMYISWAVVHNWLVIYLSVRFSEDTVLEANKTSVIVHDLLNLEMNSEIREEAMLLSMQLLHQVPRFTANGLFNLDYPLLVEGSRFVTTFMGLLLQFAT
ncbi:putative gustatory receptor 28b [Plutella xylostella]|uniref:putative gustatory receptor 28b n=1 Tax=Plutella xylostella TaxID=51655 RepID=UPI002032BCB0|nr:putative gustatory receptor 28b [Plutella xylostella]